MIYKYSIDVDGTLLNGRGKIKRSTKKYIKENRANFTINTGRGFNEAKKISDKLQISNFSSGNGSKMYVNGSIIEKPFSKKDFDDAVRKFHNSSIYFPHSNTFIDKEIQLNPRYLKHNPQKVKAIFNESYAIFAGNGEINSDYIWFGEEKSIEFSSSKNNKASIFNYLKDISFHIGDSVNDLFVNPKVKIVALKNSVFELKEKADIISPFSNEDGLEKTIEWIEEGMPLIKFKSRIPQTDIMKIHAKNMENDNRYLRYSLYADKLAIKKLMQRHDIKSPKTLFTFNEKGEQSERPLMNGKVILKSSTGSGTTLIADSKHINKAFLKKIYKNFNSANKFWKKNGEIQYMPINNVCFAEELIPTKFFEVKIHFSKDWVIPTVIIDRDNNPKRISFADDSLKDTIEYIHNGIELKADSIVGEMSKIKKCISYTKKISKEIDIPFRADFMVTDKDIYIGEITFAHNAGKSIYKNNKSLYDKYKKSISYK